MIYDIRDEKRLRKVAKVMEMYAVRVQKSVFEMDAPESILKQVMSEVARKIKKEDYVVYFKICEKDWQKREKYGKLIYKETPQDYEIL